MAARTRPLFTENFAANLESVRLFLLSHPEFHVIFEREPSANFDPIWWDGLVILARGD